MTDEWDQIFVLFTRAVRDVDLARDALAQASQPHAVSAAQIALAKAIDQRNRAHEALLEEEYDKCSTSSQS